MKKLLLGLGSLTAVATPVVAVISCGNDDSSETKKPTKKTSQTIEDKGKTLDIDVEFKTNNSKAMEDVIKEKIKKYNDDKDIKFLNIKIINSARKSTKQFAFNKIKNSKITNNEVSDMIYFGESVLLPGASDDKPLIIDMTLNKDPSFILDDSDKFEYDKKGLLHIKFLNAKITSKNSTSFEIAPSKSSSNIQVRFSQIRYLKLGIHTAYKDMRPKNDVNSVKFILRDNSEIINKPLEKSVNNITATIAKSNYSFNYYFLSIDELLTQTQLKVGSITATDGIVFFLYNNDTKKLFTRKTFGGDPVNFNILPTNFAKNLAFEIKWHKSDNKFKSIEIVSEISVYGDFVDKKIKILPDINYSLQISKSHSGTLDSVLNADITKKNKKAITSPVSSSSSGGSKNKFKNALANLLNKKTKTKTHGFHFGKDPVWKGTGLELQAIIDSNGKKTS